MVIGGSAGIGFETARVACAEGAKVILTGWDPERLQRAATELGALSNVAFDATDPTALEQFFRDLPGTIDHVMVTAGRPYCGRLVDMDFAEARKEIGVHLLVPLQVAWNAVGKVRPGGTLLFMGGTRARRPVIGLKYCGRGDRRTPRARGQPGARDRADPSEPHRRRLRGHTLCRHRFSASNSKSAAISFAPRFRSGGSLDRTLDLPMSPRSPYTS